MSPARSSTSTHRWPTAGIGHIKWELEDLSFRYLEPEQYKQIAQLLHERRLDREQYITNVVQQLRTN